MKNRKVKLWENWIKSSNKQTLILLKLVIHQQTSNFLCVLNLEHISNNSQFWACAVNILSNVYLNALFKKFIFPPFLSHLCMLFNLYKNGFPFLCFGLWRNWTCSKENICGLRKSSIFRLTSKQIRSNLVF